ncbi:MAG: type IV secretion system protein [Hyphomonadaceae bacterium]|nr:type IV secretion system protein [Hyphomonadaceae bacterium]
MAICPASTNSGMVPALIETVDCHIRVLVHESYRELVGPNTMFAAAFTGLLTIYIALLGYQLLFGRGGLRVTELPITVLKIGLILAFLTSWAAYQTVYFSLLFDGPRDLTRALLAPLARAGSGFDGDIYGGLERAFRDLSGAAGVYGAQAPPTANILQGGPSLGSGLLWISAIGMLMATIGVILAAKIVLAFLLAIGPVFVGLFLFDRTRGLFDGWLRTTIAFALAPLATTVFSAAMLMMLQPFLALLAANAARNEFEMGVIITIALIVAVFTIVTALSFRIGMSIASGFQSGRGRAALTLQSEAAQERAFAGADRAEQFAARVALNARRGEIETEASAASNGRRALDAADAVSDPTPMAARLGQSYRRTPRPQGGANT